MSGAEPGAPAAHDAGPKEAAKWRFVRRRTTAVMAGHGYREVQPGALEPVEPRPPGRGEAFDLGNGTLLRADPVSAMARLFVAGGDGETFARWLTSGVVFDPTAAGPHRWRSYHAVSGAIFGVTEPAGDAEVASLLGAVARDLDLVDAQVALSTIGDDGDVSRWLEMVRELLPLRCPSCLAAHDPLRFLSCSEEGCRALAASAPPLRDFVSVSAQKHHESVLATLEASGVAVVDDPRLAFGHERYLGTVVELRARPAGAEPGSYLPVARGGRREDLLPALGGPTLPTLGFTLGVARAALCVPGDGEAFESSCEVFFAARGAGARAWALKAAAVERQRGFRVDVDLREVGWAEQLSRAERVRARVVVVVSDTERKRGEVALRDMSTREVRHIPEDRLSFEIKRLLR